MYTYKQRVHSALIVIAFVFSLAVMILPLSASAAGDKSMTLSCVKDDVVLDGMNWKIYRVGERDGGDFVLTGSFAAYPVDLRDMSAENVIAAAQTLESYSIADGIQPLATGVTDANGKVVFSGLENGLYLAVGKRLRKDPYTYISTPLLLEISDKDQSFSFDAYPKIVRATLSSEATSHTVKKVWLDYDNNFEARPTYVTVDLFRDEELFDTVTLNEENNWEHKWVSLDSDHEWRVVERKIPVNYIVRIEYNETQYLILNRHIDIMDWDEVTRTTTTTTVTTPPAVITGSETETTSVSTQTDIQHGTTTTTSALVSTTSPPTTLPPSTTPPPQSAYTGGGKSKLPQTGQLWWPVAPLGLGGTLMVLTGIMVKPKKDEDEE